MRRHLIFRLKYVHVITVMWSGLNIADKILEKKHAFSEQINSVREWNSVKFVTTENNNLPLLRRSEIHDYLTNSVAPIWNSPLRQRPFYTPLHVFPCTSLAQSSRYIFNTLTIRLQKLCFLK